MKKLIFLLFLYTTIFSIQGQTPQKNLQKYWDYRQQLEEKFVWVSPCNEPGSNIPASKINTHIRGTSISWDDGNKILPYYIGLLATEYRLLKDNNINYTRTRDELYYTLLAFERLDMTAETFDFTGRSEFNCDLRTIYSPSFNGFFLRDDVGPTTFSSAPFCQYAYENGGSYKANMYQGTSTTTTNGSGLVMSKDMVWNLMNGFALVKALVDDPTTYPNIEGNNQTLQEMVSDISLKILDQLYGINGDWIIHYPLNGCIISYPSHSGDVNEPIPPLGTVPFNYGFIKEIEWISGTTSNYSAGSNAQGSFNNNANDVLGINAEPDRPVEIPEVDNFSFLSMYSVMGGHFDYIQAASDQAAADMHYPFFFLLNQVLHRDNNVFNDPNRMNYFYTWLNHAPPDGPRYYGDGSPKAEPSRSQR